MLKTLVGNFFCPGFFEVLTTKTILERKETKVTVGDFSRDGKTVMRVVSTYL